MAAVIETGTYAGPVDLLSKFRTFVTAQGWTENLYDDEGAGKRLHIQKVVGSRTLYFNFRSVVNEVLHYTYQPADPTFYGIMMNGSTGFLEGSSAFDSMAQPGSPPLREGVQQGGFILTASVSKAYKFIAAGSYISIVIVDEEGDYQHMIMMFDDSTFGNLCSCSFSYVLYYTAYVFLGRNILLRNRETSDYRYYGCSSYLTSGWVPCVSSPPSTFERLYPVFNTVGGNVGNMYSILTNSPSPSIGVPVLSRLSLFHGTSSPSEFRQQDGVDGIKILNKKYINDGDTITVGGTDYVVYTANYDLPDYGIAFKVS